jgi:soluble P-type ATPase
MERKMLEIDIPGGTTLKLQYLVSDYNGTLACDGHLLDGLDGLLRDVAKILDIHVVTADTFGIAKKSLEGLPVRLTILPPGNQTEQKADYVRTLGPQETVTLGNGRNDLVMLREAALGVCVMEGEGACVESLLASKIVCRSAHDALQLLLRPQRLIATLRA